MAARRVRRAFIPVQLGLLGLCLLLPTAVVAASISVGYLTTQALPSGAIVAPDSQNNGAVVPADSDSNSNILGVVVVDSTLAVSQANTQVQVTTEGVAKVLVSNINGSVNKGDRIIASPLAGIGMKATETGKVLGVAQDSLSAKSTGVQYQTVTDKLGKQKQVMVGLVPLTINITTYQPDTGQTALPGFIKDVSGAISGKSVSPTRIWSSLIILLVTLLVVVVLLYGAVRSSIGAIGRNPLAKSAIQRSMTRVILLAVFILSVSSSAIYVILRG